METLKEPHDLVKNDRYSEYRQATLAALDLGSIDRPVIDIVRSFAALPYCFTLQSCYGHFLCAPDQDIRSLNPIPPGYPGLVRYRIAYVAFCIENSRAGRALLESLGRITALDPGYVQFGSPDWFWKRFANSYALQVEPARYMRRDEAILKCAEALHVQQTREFFFTEIRKLLDRPG